MRILDSTIDASRDRIAAYPGARQIIDVAVDLVQTGGQTSVGDVQGSGDRSGLELGSASDVEDLVRR